MDPEIPNERTRGEDDPVNSDPSLGTPFSKVVPNLRWHGKTLSLLKLPVPESSAWIVFSFAKPTGYQKLVPQKDTKIERIFFNMERQKFLKVNNDNISWSYYITGPFQRMEGGSWIDIDGSKDVNDEDLESIGEEEKSEKDCYKLNPLTGIVKVLPRKEEAKKKTDIEIAQDQDVQTNNPYADIITQILVFKTEKGLNEKEKIEKDILNNKAAWAQGGSILMKINGLQDFKNWKEAIIKGEGSQIPTIKTNKIMEAFEEICELYKIRSELVRHQLGDLDGDIAFPIDNMNDVKFVVGVILPELYLYPQSFLKNLSSKKIYFCGLIERKGHSLMSTTDNENLYLNTKERNIMKIQQGFHQGIFREIAEYFPKRVPSFETHWKALNPPDFTYSLTRKKAPKGLKGFLTFSSLLKYSNDVEDIYFALIKDPRTVLEHSDIIIAKKSHLLKTVLGELCPEGINDKWWERVQSYKDIIELALGTTETFKEANLENLNPNETGDQEETADNERKNQIAQ